MNDIEYESSVVLHGQQTPDKVKNVEECLNDEIHNKKRKTKTHGMLIRTCACLSKVKKKDHQLKMNKILIKRMKQVLIMIALKIVQYENTMRVITMRMLSPIDLQNEMRKKAINTPLK